MLRVSEGQGTRLPKTRAAQRSTLTSVLQFLGKPAACTSTQTHTHLAVSLPWWPPPGCRWESADATPVCCLFFQSLARPAMHLAPTAPPACRHPPQDASSPLSLTAPTACWESAATTTTAGLSRTGAQVVHTTTTESLLGLCLGTWH